MTTRQDIPPVPVPFRLAVPDGVWLRERLTRTRWPDEIAGSERWTDMARGGHFAALEVPELLAGDIAAFFRPLCET